MKKIFLAILVLLSPLSASAQIAIGADIITRDTNTQKRSLLLVRQSDSSYTGEYLQIDSVDTNDIPFRLYTINRNGALIFDTFVDNKTHGSYEIDNDIIEDYVELKEDTGYALLAIRTGPEFEETRNNLPYTVRSGQVVMASMPNFLDTIYNADSGIKNYVRTIKLNSTENSSNRSIIKIVDANNNTAFVIDGRTNNVGIGEGFENIENLNTAASNYPFAQTLQVRGNAYITEGVTIQHGLQVFGDFLLPGYKDQSRGAKCIEPNDYYALMVQFHPDHPDYDSGIIRRQYMAETECSDRRVKKDIEDLHYGLDFVRKIQPKTYRFNHEGEDKPPRIGFIAQDILSAESEKTDDYDKQKESLFVGLNEADNMFILNYDLFSTVAIQAIKDLDAEKAILEQENAQLKSRVAQMEEGFNQVFERLEALEGNAD